MRRVFIVQASEAIDDLPGGLPPLSLSDVPDPVVYTIAPLSAGWHDPLPERTYRCGAGPLEALSDALDLLGRGDAEAAVLVGEDLLKSGYGPEERRRGMDIFAPVALPEAYTLLAQAFCARWGLSQRDFEELAEALRSNYLASWRRLKGADVAEPDPRWLEKVTPWFRGVDCANPHIDYRGRILLLAEDALERLSSPPPLRVEVAGLGLGALPVDGPDHVERLASFEHLAAAAETLRRMTGLSPASLIADPRCLLEAYTCYPVIPLALLLVTGAVASPSGLLDFLHAKKITVTGGMNLARAPWNCPALRALIAMARRLTEGPETLGLVHANGGLGARQGLALLRRG